MPKLNLVSGGGLLAGIEGYAAAVGGAVVVELAHDLGGKAVTTGVDPGEDSFGFCEAENVFGQQPGNAVEVSIAAGTLFSLADNLGSHLG